MRQRGAFLRLFGGIWAGVTAALALVFAMIFATTPSPASPAVALALSTLVGLLLYAIGQWQRAQALTVFRNGVEVSAKTLAVERNYKVRMNGRHPWRLRYRFEVDGAVHETAVHYWTVRPPTTKPGERIVVLHDPKNPSHSVIWTNLDPAEESVDRVVAAEATARLGPRGARIAAADESEDEFSAEFIDEDVGAKREAK